MKHIAPCAQALFILGDCFDYWIGDDDQTKFHQDILRDLRAYTKSGKALFFMHGNRDFLIGKTFAKLTSAALLPDPFLPAQHPGVLLTHGDLLCTDDRRYQQFRKIVRSLPIKFLFSKLPLSWRHAIALKMRKTSQHHTERYQQQRPEIMDVTPKGVLAMLKKHPATVLIHGHTHRLNIHTHANYHRVVLGDWHKKGSFISLSESDLTLSEFDLHSMLSSRRISLESASTFSLQH